jgi:two-component system, sensor histidine kinase PdtaS
MKSVLAESSAAMQALLASAPDAIFVVDAQGRIALANSEAGRLFGYTLDELYGQPIEMLVPERSRGAHVADRDAYAAEPRLRPMGAGRALSGRRRDGSELPVEISLSPLQTAGGTFVISIVRDVSEQRAIVARMEASLREKDALLREIHHRVKNNLQITSSLLRLQAAAIADPAARDLFAAAQARIRSMALVHEKLYHSANLARIDFTDYVRTLGALLLTSYGAESTVALTVEGGDVFLGVDLAVPCGLIVNELLANALKHAFPNGRRGTIAVRLRRLDGGACELTLRDNGVGMPDAEAGGGGTLGMQLVRALLQQIGGELQIHVDGGTEIVLRFRTERSDA